MQDSAPALSRFRYACKGRDQKKEYVSLMIELYKNYFSVSCVRIDWFLNYLTTLPPQNSACRGPIYMKQKVISKFGKSLDIHYKFFKVAPLVHVRKSSYLFYFIAIAQDTSLQLISLCNTSPLKQKLLSQKSNQSKACWDIEICKTSV